jgi:serine O-acetyltransferase
MSGWVIILGFQLDSPVVVGTGTYRPSSRIGADRLGYALRMSLESDLIADLDAHNRRFGKPSPRSARLALVAAAFNPYFCPVLLYRLAFATRHSMHGIPGILFSRVNYFLFGLEIARQCEIGPGMFLPHTRGTVIGASRIGSNAVIYHGVTLGARTIDGRFDPSTRPVLGDDVIIGAGAVIIGPIIVGNGARIGGNCMVVDDVPPGTTLVAPSPIVVRFGDNALASFPEEDRSYRS